MTEVITTWLRSQPGHGFPEPLRFGGIEGAHAAVEVDVAVGAGPGAARAHDQEGGGASGEAFADVRAAGLLADRVEPEVDQQIRHRPDPLPLGRLDPQPGRLGGGGPGVADGHGVRWAEADCREAGRWSCRGRPDVPHPLKSLHRDVAQLGSALRSGRRGRRFESCHPDFLSPPPQAPALLFSQGCARDSPGASPSGRPEPGWCCCRPARG